MTLLNACERVCAPNPKLLAFQYKGYAGYNKRCELRGALDTVQEGKSFFACHPHGILSIGWICNVVFGRNFHKVVGRCNYLIDPTLRNKGLLAKLFLDAFEGPHGSIRDTRATTMHDLMRKGESISMIPGAYQEATRFSHGLERVALAQRRGFVKYCLRYGYRLHPVYTFGESQTYSTLGGFDKLRLWLNRKGIPTVCFWGLPWCPLLPRCNLELLTFVGPALELPKLPEPTEEEVDHWHKQYMKALVELFDRHKAEAGTPAAVLEIL
ncbi:DGAT2D [Symbiodinium pilosum]|uniref:diacylglycerol O-acyltransferase n=1 Tax=Symbiodinium pilosum TaxID=2952 RepID=A0A812SKU3_SYMPI|nr:DGAT2D [Symbiodinium pilosum]